MTRVAIVILLATALGCTPPVAPPPAPAPCPAILPKAPAVLPVRTAASGNPAASAAPIPVEPPPF